MIKDEANPLVIDIAKGFIRLVMSIEPGWSKAYLRFLAEESESEVKGSVVSGSAVQIIDVLKHKEFLHAVASKGRELLHALGMRKDCSY